MINLIYRNSLANTIIFCAFFLAGCTSNVSGVQKFANAGAELTAAFPVLYEETALQGADLAAHRLQNHRDNLSNKERRELFKDTVNDLNAYREQIEALKAHAGELGRLFGVMSQLANSDAPKRFGEEAVELVGNLDSISGGRLASASNIDLGDLAGFVGEVTIRAKISGNLRRFLTEHGDTLVTQLELHEKALSAISAKFEDDADAQRSNLLIFGARAPYVGEGPIPKQWRSTFTASLLSPKVLPAFRGAKKSLKDAKFALEALLKGEESDNFDLFISDVSRVLKIIEDAKGK